MYSKYGTPTVEWQLADAKRRFRERFRRALTEGPQRVRRGHVVAVVVAELDYEKLTGKQPDFKAFLLGKGPSLERLALVRDRSALRDGKLGVVPTPA